MQNKIVRVSDSTEVTEIVHGSFHFKSQTQPAGRFRWGNIIAYSIEFDYFLTNGITIAEGDALLYSQITDLSPDLSTTVDPPREISINTFYVKSVTRGKKTCHVVAYDAVCKTKVDYSQRLKELADSGNFPETIADLIDDAASVAGVTTTLSNYSAFPLFQAIGLNVFYAEGITVLDIFKFAAELYGRNAYASTANSVDASRYGTTTYGDWLPSLDYVIAPGTGNTYVDPVHGETLYNVPYKENGLEFGDAMIPYDGVEFRKADGTLAGSYYATTPATNIYTVSTNIIAESTVVSLDRFAQQIYNSLSSFAISRPFVAKLFPFMNPYKCGNDVYVVDENGNVTENSIMFMDMTESEVTVQSFGSNITTEYDSSYNDAQDKAMSLSAQINALAQTHRYATYNRVSQLGLTVGSATIQDAYANLPDYSILITTNSNFASGETPGTGLVQIVRRTQGIGYIMFYGYTGVGDYRMFQNSGTITGTWEKVYYSDPFQAGTALVSGDDLHNLTPGVYYSASATVTSALTNVPPGVTGGFRLEVKLTIANANRKTLVLYTNEANGRTFLQNQAVNNAWGSWRLVSTTTV